MQEIPPHIQSNETQVPGHCVAHCALYAVSRTLYDGSAPILYPGGPVTLQQVVGGAGGGARTRERGASVDGDTSVMRADRWAGHLAHGAELYPLSAAVRRAASPCMTRSR